MYEFLNVLDNNALLDIVKADLPPSIKNKKYELDRSQLYSVLFSLFGYDILFSRKVRLALFQALSLSELKKLCQLVKIDIANTRYDTSVALSVIPLRLGSELTKFFATKFNVDHCYLPTAKRSSLSLEFLSPVKKLPSLFDYQQEIVRKLDKFLSTNDPSVCSSLVQLPTGSGKTRTILTGIIRNRNNIRLNGSRKILWLAHTEELCEQAIESFKEIWTEEGNEEILVSRLWGDYKVNSESTSADFIFASFQKLVNLRKNDASQFKDITSNTSIVIVDEAHKALAPSIKSLLTEFKRTPICKLVGLSATPGRDATNQKQNIMLAEFFDSYLITSEILGKDPIKFLQRKGILSKVNRVESNAGVNVSLTEKEKEIFEFEAELSTTILKRLARDEKRNEIITNIVLNEIKNGNPTLIFACSVEHAKLLSILISVAGFPSASINCHMNKNSRKRVIDAFKRNEIMALLNYGVLSTGFDAPNIKSIVIARPTSSVVLYSQMVGRGLRGHKVGGTEDVNLIDIRDNFENFGSLSEVYNYFENIWTRH